MMGGDGVGIVKNNSEADNLKFEIALLEKENTMWNQKCTEMHKEIERLKSVIEELTRTCE